ncbi:hypothetical protein SDC9_151177 [bioreactor metagenome]|uniref:Flagellar protein n=1 Tax=bioreactor metagenome TaxID=1076179 RepID=A0A645ERP4_9ZZZZ|nr:flagellar biosynthetic protein FliO [Lutispora sp.]MEA4962752.1 flagellar biosynthetic protein FliO [Lutispora sp.]HCJ58197.1 hypothetical protein [Clostridiaceae bacterium]
MNAYNETSVFMGFFKLIFILIIFLMILGLSYYFTKFIGKKFTGKNRLMKHIETLPFGNDKNLHIVQICGEFYLISSSQRGVCLLEKLSSDLLSSFDMDRNSESIDFDNCLDDSYENIDVYKNRYSIKQNLEKLKNIAKRNKTDE